MLRRRPAIRFLRMSSFYDKAEEIAAALQEAVTLDEATVLTQRDKDIKAKVDEALERIKGAVILVEWRGAPGADDGVDDPRLNNTFVVLVACNTLLRKKKNKMIADDLVELAAKTLNGWNPQKGTPMHDCYKDLRVTSIDPVDSADGFESYLITTQQTIQL